MDEGERLLELFTPSMLVEAKEDPRFGFCLN